MRDDNITPKFDTCFFERYAKETLVTLLGEQYCDLVNRDRPDLQDPIRGLGIEVTRAMHESKAEAISLLNEMAADEIVEQPDMTNRELYKIGYTYGLMRQDVVGPTEYRYWCEASTINRVLENKVRKVIDGFYGNFEHQGLYIFSKDDTQYEDILMAMRRVNQLQAHATNGFEMLYISEIQNLFVCNMKSMTVEKYPISEEMCRIFFHRAARGE